jgi:hypothetical protein
MKRWTCFIMFTAVSMLVVGACVSSQSTGKTEKGSETEVGDRVVSLEDIPAPARQTILREAGDNTIEEIEVETENGRTVYEAEWEEDGKEVEVEVAPDGKLLGKEVEQDDDEEDDGNDHDNDDDHGDDYDDDD